MATAPRPTKLGAIPPFRIASHPSPGAATEEDCLRLGERYELIDGTLIEKAMPHGESFLTAWLANQIFNLVIEADLGFCTGHQTRLTLKPGLIRMPDVAFFPWENARGVIHSDAPAMVPDLVLEVLAPDNTNGEIDQKCSDFFEFGTKLFWKVDPVKKLVEVHTPTGKARILRKSDILTGGKVLPGFELPVKEIFDYLDGVLAEMNGSENWRNTAG